MPIEIGDIRLYSISELAEKLKLTEVTLRSYLRAGKMRGKKMGTSWYVTEEALREYFDGLTPFSLRPATSSTDKPQKQRKREGKRSKGN